MNAQALGLNGQALLDTLFQAQAQGNTQGTRRRSHPRTVPRTRWYLSGLIAGLALFGACAQARAEDIPLIKKGGYEIPVEINGVITLNFTLDTGASEVQIPVEYFSHALSYWND